MVQQPRKIIARQNNARQFKRIRKPASIQKEPVIDNQVINPVDLPRAYSTSASVNILSYSRWVANNERELRGKTIKQKKRRYNDYRQRLINISNERESYGNSNPSLNEAKKLANRDGRIYFKIGLRDYGSLDINQYINKTRRELSKYKPITKQQYYNQTSQQIAKIKEKRIQENFRKKLAEQEKKTQERILRQNNIPKSQWSSVKWVDNATYKTLQELRKQGKNPVIYKGDLYEDKEAVVSSIIDKNYSGLIKRANILGNLQYKRDKQEAIIEAQKEFIKGVNDFKNKKKFDKIVKLDTTSEKTFIPINIKEIKKPNTKIDNREKRINQLMEQEKKAATRSERTEDIFKKIPLLGGENYIQRLTRDILAAPTRYTIGFGEQVIIIGGKIASAAESLLDEETRKATTEELKNTGKKVPLEVIKSADVREPENLVNIATLLIGGKLGNKYKPELKNKKISKKVKATKLKDKIIRTIKGEYKNKAGKNVKVDIKQTIGKNQKGNIEIKLKAKNEKPIIIRKQLRIKPAALKKISSLTPNFLKTANKTTKNIINKVSNKLADIKLYKGIAKANTKQRIKNISEKSITSINKRLNSIAKDFKNNKVTQKTFDRLQFIKDDFARFNIDIKLKTSALKNKAGIKLKIAKGKVKGKVINVTGKISLPFKNLSKVMEKRISTIQKKLSDINLYKSIAKNNTNVRIKTITKSAYSRIIKNINIVKQSIKNNKVTQKTLDRLQFIKDDLARFNIDIKLKTSALKNKAGIKLKIAKGKVKGKVINVTDKISLPFKNLSKVMEKRISTIQKKLSDINLYRSIAKRNTNVRIKTITKTAYNRIIKNINILKKSIKNNKVTQKTLDRLQFIKDDLARFNINIKLKTSTLKNKTGIKLKIAKSKVKKAISKINPFEFVEIKPKVLTRTIKKYKLPKRKKILQNLKRYGRPKTNSKGKYLFENKLTGELKTYSRFIDWYNSTVAHNRFLNSVQGKRTLRKIKKAKTRTARIKDEKLKRKAMRKRKTTIKKLTKKQRKSIKKQAKSKIITNKNKIKSIVKVKTEQSINSILKKYKPKTRKKILRNLKRYGKPIKQSSGKYQGKYLFENKLTGELKAYSSFIDWYNSTVAHNRFLNSVQGKRALRKIKKAKTRTARIKASKIERQWLRQDALKKKSRQLKAKRKLTKQKRKIIKKRNKFNTMSRPVNLEQFFSDTIKVKTFIGNELVEISIQKPSIIKDIKKSKINEFKKKQFKPRKKPKTDSETKTKTGEVLITKTETKKELKTKKRLKTPSKPKLNEKSKNKIKKLRKQRERLNKNIIEIKKRKINFKEKLRLINILRFKIKQNIKLENKIIVKQRPKQEQKPKQKQEQRPKQEQKPKQKTISKTKIGLKFKPAQKIKVKQKLKQRQRIKQKTIKETIKIRKQKKKTKKKKLLKIEDEDKRKKKAEQYIKSKKNKKQFIYFADLAAILAGEKAKGKQKKQLLKKGRIFTGQERRLLV